MCVCVNVDSCVVERSFLCTHSTAPKTCAFVCKIMALALSSWPYLFYNRHGDSCSEVPQVHLIAAHHALHLCGSSPLHIATKPTPLAYVSWSVQSRPVRVTKGIMGPSGLAQPCVEQTIFNTEEIISKADSSSHGVVETCNWKPCRVTLKGKSP